MVQQEGKVAWIGGRKPADVYMNMWISCQREDEIDEFID